MKKFLFFIIFTLAMVSMSAAGKNPALEKLETNAKYSSAVADSCLLRVANDGQYFYIEFDIPFPVLQMHLMRHGFTINVDPTNKKSESISIDMPFADDIMRNLRIEAPKPANITDIDALRNMPRPDFTPVLNTIAKRGVMITINDDTELMPIEDVSIEMTPGYTLQYKMVIPMENLTAGKTSKKWKVGIKAKGMEIPEGGFPGFGGTPGPPPGMFGGPIPGMGMPGMGPGRFKFDSLMTIMRDGIDQWITFKLQDTTI